MSEMSEYENMHAWDHYLRLVMEDARLEAHRALGIHGPHRIKDQHGILLEGVDELMEEIHAPIGANALHVDRRVYEEAIQVIGVAARIAAVARRRLVLDPSSKRLTISYEEGYEVGYDKGYADGLAAEEPNEAR